MTNVIDCDTVFDILTRAPFDGAGSVDRQVEDHLYVCHECRQLAEALRPAVDLFHESLAETDSLPKYTGTLPVATLPVALPRYPVPGCPESRRSRISAPALIAASLVICALGWLSLESDGNGENHRPARSMVASPNTTGRLTLTGLQLPQACRTIDDLQAGSQPLLDFAANRLEGESGVDFGCCTKCHRSGGTGPATDRALRALDLACAACHRRTDAGKLAGAKLMKLGCGTAEEPFPFVFGDRA